MSSKKTQSIEHPLRAAMDAKEHTIRDLSTYMGVTVQAVHKWLNFDATPSASTFLGLAAYCDAEVGPFIADWEIARQAALEERRARLS